jgi:dTMP kinase
VFIVFEGVDGAGKSSQLARLAERVDAAGREVVRLVEPTHGPIGAEIRRRAREGPPLGAREELDLFLADRRQNVDEQVRPALARGAVVVQDRYYHSTAAYQAARPELGLGPDEVIALHAGWAPRPDLVLLLDLPVARGLERVRRRGPGDAFEEVGRQEAVRRTFLALAAADPTFAVIDAARDPDPVAADVWARVVRLLDGSREHAPDRPPGDAEA